MVSDEVEGLFIADFLPAILILLNIVKGPYHTVSFEGLVHVRLHRAENSVANSVQLVVNCEKWPHHIIAEDCKQEEENDKPVGDAQQEVEQEEQVCYLTEYTSEAMEDSAVEDINVFREAAENFSDRCDIEEEVDWRTHYFGKQS